MLNLRFPGQYYDAETGMHYNIFRDYYPQLGRYIQADPIGLMGDNVNLFRYANTSPLTTIDPLGLISLTDILWRPQNTSVNWESYSYGMLTFPMGGALSATLMYGGMLGLSPKEALVGAFEGVKRGVGSGYYGCYAKCMLFDPGIIDVPIILAPAGGHLIAEVLEHVVNRIATPLSKKIYVPPSLNRKMYYNMVKIPKLTYSIKAAGKVLLKGGGWAVFGYEAYHCIHKCLDCLDGSK